MFTFTPATLTDSQDIFDWRNDPQTRAMSLQTAPITREDHKTWLQNSLKNTDRKLWIVKKETKNIAILRFDITQETAEISINLNPEERGKKYAVRIIKEGIADFKAQTPHIKLMNAIIKNENIASKTAFMRAGFAEHSTTNEISTYHLRVK